MSQLIYKNYLLEVQPSGKPEFTWEGLILNETGKVADFQVSEEWFDLDEFKCFDDASIALKVGCMILDEFLKSQESPVM